MHLEFHLQKKKKTAAEANIHVNELIPHTHTLAHTDSTAQHIIVKIMDGIFGNPKEKNNHENIFIFERPKKKKFPSIVNSKSNEFK